MRAPSRVLQIDEQASARISLPRGPGWLRLLALAIAHSGDSLLWLGVAAAALIWGDALWRSLGWRIVAGTLCTGLATAGLKRLFRRHRPPNDTRGLYLHADRYAFPSGHAGRTACLALLAAPLLSGWALALPPLWVVAVGLARISLGIHFLSDIVAGWLAGVLVGLLLLALF